MKMMTIGSKRPRLSLAYAGAPAPRGPAGRGRPLSRGASPTLSGTLSPRELRRIVTELLG